MSNQQTQEPQGGSETRPEWLPEKFKTAEDMAKAYGELEKKVSTNVSKPDPNEDIAAWSKKFFGPQKTSLQGKAGELAQKIIDASGLHGKQGDFATSAIMKNLHESQRNLSIKEASDFVESKQDSYDRISKSFQSADEAKDFTERFEKGEVTTHELNIRYRMGGGQTQTTVKKDGNFENVPSGGKGSLTKEAAEDELKQMFMTAGHPLNVFHHKDHAKAKERAIELANIVKDPYYFQELGIKPK